MTVKFSLDFSDMVSLGLCFQHEFLCFLLGVKFAKQCVFECRDRIGLAVLKMLEKGHLQKMHNTWWYGKGECVVDDSKVCYVYLHRTKYE